jgi:hypothetical protein
MNDLNLPSPVTVAAPLAETITVDYATEDGSARAGEHYVPVMDTLTFEPGETDQTIAVPILGNATNGTDRTFAKPFRWSYTGRPVTAETVKRSATWKENWASCRANGQTLALVG